MTGIHLQWEGFSQDDWEKTISQIPRSNSFHDWDMAELTAKHGKFKIERCLIRRKQSVIGLAQLYTKTYLGMLKHRKLIRGPLFCKPPMPDELGECLTKIRSSQRFLKGYVTLTMPELPDTDAITRELSKLNFNRIEKGYQSIWIDLRKSDDELRKALHSKWRNQLSKAEGNDFQIEVNNKMGEIALLANCEEQQETRGFTAMPPALYFELPAHKKLCLTLNYGGENIAGVFFQLHGKSATYQLSHSDETGKSLNAMNYLLWQGMLKLKELGITSLDLGGIEPDKNPGLARFKERMGGESFTLTGSYS